MLSCVRRSIDYQKIISSLNPVRASFSMNIFSIYFLIVNYIIFDFEI